MQKIPKQVRVCYFLLIFGNPFSCRYLLVASVSSTTDLSKQKKKKKNSKKCFGRHAELQVEKTRD